MNALEQFDADRKRARDARYEARELRELSQIARCGVGTSHGSKTVPHRIALRIADQYLIWADEYDETADAIERRLESALSSLATKEATS